jgi:hypothetical protein
MHQFELQAQIGYSFDSVGLAYLQQKSCLPFLQMVGNRQVPARHLWCCHCAVATASGFPEAFFRHLLLSNFE